jgi:DNA-binding XRE family transcriptional regulator
MKTKAFSGRKLAAARAALGLTRSDVARMVQRQGGRFTRFHPNSLRNHETGRSMVDLDTAIVYAHILTEGDLSKLME